MTNDTLRKLRKNHFIILNCLTLIDNTHRTLNCTWKTLWPDCVAERDFEGYDHEDSALNDEVVSMGKSMGLEVESEDVHELLKSHEIELNTEEL